MQRKLPNPFLSFVFIFILMCLACATTQPKPMGTNTPQPTSTETVIPTKTPRPSATPSPTWTPDLAATQRMEKLNAETQKYFDLGYLTTTQGRFIEYPDFTKEWAVLTSIYWGTFDDQARDFFMSAHFKWSSAYRNADVSGCGFAFAVQDNNDHYLVFLDRSKIFFLESGFLHSTPIGLTRGSGRVKFDNPADHPAEADFTLIVKGASAYVLVNSELVSEYTLSPNRNLHGRIGLALLSGTARDYGTRCEMTNIHLWIPNE